MKLSFESAALLLLIAAVVAMLTRRLRLPYSAGLVAAGMGLALLPFSPRLSLTKELLFTVLLPPLIFEAAFHLPWKPLRRDLSLILVLATAGVLLSASVTAVGMYYAAHWDWLSALVFGVLIAATDPVSVVATFREARAHGRLLLLVEAESLFNDGTAAVWLPAIAAILLVLLGRAVAIYPCCFLFSWSALRVSWRHQHILFWGGLRGALALALALGLPPEVPARESIITMSFAVVAFSVFVQGLTMTPLLRRIGEIPNRSPVHTP
jgi:NhaP-type Na+/H+ or K+/H+ antiporter